MTALPPPPLVKVPFLEAMEERTLSCLFEAGSSSHVHYNFLCLFEAGSSSHVHYNFL
ncbi:hypothetical protein YC2023_085708 [Brassica napus]